MKIILTAKEPIKAKDGVEYVKCSFIAVATGISGDVFTTKDKYEAFGVSDKSYLDKELLKELSVQATVVDVEFDQRGRVVALG